MVLRLSLFLIRQIGEVNLVLILLFLRKQEHNHRGKVQIIDIFMSVSGRCHFYSENKFI